MNPNTVRLRDLNTQAEILISGYQECRINRAIVRKLDEVGDQKGVDALLLVI